MPHLYLRCTHCIISESVLSLNRVSGGISSLTQNLMQIRCSTHSVILNVMATQYTGSLNDIYRPHWPAQCSSLFMRVHPSSLSLAARLHRCCTNCSHYINKSWTFSGQTSCNIRQSLLVLTVKTKSINLITHKQM